MDAEEYKESKRSPKDTVLIEALKEQNKNNRWIILLMALLVLVVFGFGVWIGGSSPNVRWNLNGDENRLIETEQKIEISN